MTQAAPPSRAGYDWKACAIAVIVGLAVATPAGLIVAKITGSIALLTVVVTLVGTAVSRSIYTRIAKRGSRPLES